MSSSDTMHVDDVNDADEFVDDDDDNDIHFDDDE